MKMCINGQARIRSQGSTPKTCAVCSVSKKNPATIRNPQATIPIGLRHHECSWCSWFIGAVPSSALNAPADKIVKRPEYQRDVPTPDEALGHSEAKTAPAQQLETRQEDRQCRMLHGETREQQISRNANQVGDYEKQTEAQSEGHNRDYARVADTGLRSRPRPGHALHLAHNGTFFFRYIIPIGPISSSSAVFFCSSPSAA